MMGLVDDQQIPLGLQDRPPRPGLSNQQFQPAEHALFGQEGIVVPDRLEALLIEQRQRQIETAAHLDQPLMQQRLGGQDQHPARTPGEAHPVQDQTGLDGLAQPHLVSQEHARSLAPRDLSGDMQLMWDERHPCADQSQGR